MKIVTNSLEPGVAKDFNDCTIYRLYKSFASDEEILELEDAYSNGIAWSEAKEILFNKINKELSPIRTKYEKLKSDNDFINDLLNEGAKKARSIAKNKISQIREVIGIKEIS